MTQDRVNCWVRPAVAGMSAYVVADASGLIKLDAMENPYTLPEELRNDWAGQLRTVEINRYPDPAANSLKALMRDKLALPEQAGLILGNGSDEIIQMLALALGGEGRTFMSLEPAFVMYRMIALMNGMQYVSLDLRSDDFSIDMAATLSLIETQQPAVVFIANPNNPTGNIHTLDELRQIARVVPGVLVIDEAYAPFTDMTAMPLLQEYPHVLIMRTVSKMGLAGLRLGYLLGGHAWINELDKVRLPYNINVLSQQAAGFALMHREVFDRQAQRIRADRQAMYESLKAIEQIEVWPSEANFLLFRAPEGMGATIHAALKQQGVLIKSLSGGHPYLQDCLRVTIGTAEENQQFLSALQVSIGQL
ncbi:MAG: histidinol-phosphate transaminase [Gammaproteobacteria bacterium]|nr:histidinol-phosphate transaminase [Gammaproteobacteria bacterium]